MGQKEIVDEIRKRCGCVEKLPPIGWHFIHHGRHFFYVAGKDDGMIRFCVPHLANAGDLDAEQLSEAINETNRSVKYIKAVKLDCGSVSLGYDHKAAPDESAEYIVPHIINALDFASTYLLNKLKRT